MTSAIRLALTQKPGKLTGAEFRYLRSALQLTQRSVGKLLGCSEQAVAKWEKQGRIPKAEDYLIRRLYVEKFHGHERIGAVVDTLNAIDRVSNSKIVISESHQKWTYKIEAPDREPIAA